MVYSNVLCKLVHRASTCSRPFNTHDSLLLLKSLHGLRYRSDEVRRICEKCAFTIASARISIPVERVIDALNALTSLQTADMEVVNNHLAGRLLDVTAQTASTRAIQKSAVALIKFGRRHCRRDVAEHIFGVLVGLLHTNPTDTALHLAVVSVFPYTLPKSDLVALSYCSRPEGSDRLDAVLRSALFLAKGNIPSTLQGNCTLQALHMFPTIALCSRGQSVSNRKRNNELLNDTAGSDHNFVDNSWENVKKAFFGELQLHTVVPGGYAQFLHDFLRLLNVEESQTEGETCLHRVLSVVLHRNFTRALNSYDVAKISAALSNEMERCYSMQKRDQEEDQILCGQQQRQSHLEQKEVTLLVEAVESLVDQLHFFCEVSWSSLGSDDKTSNNRRNVDQVAVGSVWRVVQKTLCCLTVEPIAVTAAVEKIIGITKNIAKNLQDVWSWVFYSMIRCMDAGICVQELGDAAEKVVAESSILNKAAHSRQRKPLSMRSAVQALYAASLSAMKGTASCGNGLKGLDAAGSGAASGHAKPLTAALVRHLNQQRYRDYAADNVPMLLQSLTNLVVAEFIPTEELREVYELTEKVTHYVLGYRDGVWINRHFVAIYCSVVSLCEFWPESKPLKDLAGHLVGIWSSSPGENLENLRLLLWRALASAQDNSTGSLRNGGSVGNGGSAIRKAVDKFILPTAGICIDCACRDRCRNFNIRTVLHTVHLSTKLGASLEFVHSIDGVASSDPTGNATCPLVGITLDISALLDGVQMKAVDAAHVLHLMSRETSTISKNLERKIQGDVSCIEKLRRMAIGKNPGAMQVETLLHLIGANDRQPTSKRLFDEESLESIMEAVYSHLTVKHEGNGAVRRQGDEERIVCALLSSQVLVRLRRTLKNYSGLEERVGEILGIIESNKTKSAEEVFQLRLLSGV